MVEKTYTLKTLSEKTDCPPYIIKYLHQCRRLPVVKKSPGTGYKIHWGAEAVQIVKEHMEKRDASNVLYPEGGVK